MKLQLPRVVSFKRRAKTTIDTKGQSKLTSKQYEELGRIVASVYETGYLNRAQSYKMAFVKGVFQGLGGVLGATVVVALLLWVLSLFSELPLLGNLIDTFNNSVRSK